MKVRMQASVKVKGVRAEARLEVREMVRAKARCREERHSEGETQKRKWER